MTQTALDLGIAAFEERKAKHPQTRWYPPTCHMSTINEDKTCKCGSSMHLPSAGGKISDAGVFDLRRGKDGAFRWPAPKKQSTKPSVVPAKTIESIAACAGLGLAYWSEHWKPGYVWAVDENQQPHAVEIGRKDGTARHSCYSFTIEDQAGPCTHPTKGESMNWAKPVTMGGLMIMMDLPGWGADPTPTPGIDRSVPEKFDVAEKFDPALHAYELIDTNKDPARRFVTHAERGRGPFGAEITLDAQESASLANKMAALDEGKSAPKVSKPKRSKPNPTPPPAVEVDPVRTTRQVISDIECTDDNDYSFIETADLIVAYYRCTEEQGEIEQIIGAELDRRDSLPEEN